MAKLDDLIAKFLAAAALEPRGTGHRELEIPMMDSQAADFYFVPYPGPLRTGPLFHLLDTQEPCSLEFCSRTPGPALVYRSYLRKHLELYQHRCLEAAARGEPVPPMQGQWILVPGRPRRVLAELPWEPEPGWERGCYRFTRGLKVRFVVLSELPRTRETLLLRLLGPLRLRQAALEEVKQVPAEDPEGPDLLALLACVRYLIEKDPRIPRHHKEKLMDAMLQEFKRFKQSLIEQGIEQGIEKGQARAILKVLQVRGVAVGEAVRQRILSCSDARLLDRWIERAALATTAEEVVAP